MVRPAFAGRIAMAGKNDFNFHRVGAIHCTIKILNFEPEEDSIAVRP